MARLLQGGLEPCRSVQPLGLLLSAAPPEAADHYVLVHPCQFREALAAIERCLGAAVCSVVIEASRCLITIRGVAGSAADLTRLTDLLEGGAGGEVVAGFPLARRILDAQGARLELRVGAANALEATILVPLARAAVLPGTPRQAAKSELKGA